MYPTPAPQRATSTIGTPPGVAVSATGLRKVYGTGARAVTAVDGITLTVPTGSVFGLLGPNGAGKSTTVKLLTTLARPDAGTAQVAGVDVLRDPAGVRRRIGYVSQKPGFDPVGTGRENLVLQARVYGLSARAARRRADDLLGRFGLGAAANRLLRTWSGGMQRKLDVAMGLIHRPDVLFLDEPTTGLDPEARAEMWSHLADLAAGGGLTVLLTTHYLDEADRLADDLVIIDSGRVVAAGSPERLKSELHGDSIQIGVATPDAAALAVTVLLGAGAAEQATADGTRVHARVSDGARQLPRLIGVLDEHGIAVTEVTVARPSLDDVYLRYAGRSFRNADEQAPRRSGTGADPGSAPGGADPGSADPGSAPGGAPSDRPADGTSRRAVA